jgi:hypothetical protein
MLAGDIFYLAVLLACWTLAGASLGRVQHMAERVEK